jgi:hypothetical protein
VLEAPLSMIPSLIKNIALIAGMGAAFVAAPRAPATELVISGQRATRLTGQGERPNCRDLPRGELQPVHHFSPSLADRAARVLGNAS